MSKKAVLEAVATTLLLCCTVIVTGVVVKREFFDPRLDANGILPPTRIDDWVRYATGSESYGEATAIDTIVVFSDYQCPFCKTFAETTERLQAQFPGRIRVFHRNFPLSGIHPVARPYALAGLCAAQQGRFLEFHRAAFARQAELATTPPEDLATDIGLNDRESFVKCASSPSAAAELTADSIAGAELQIPGTPLVIVNGWRFNGTPGDSALAGRLRSAAR